jgi:hypothetical protein
MRPEQRGPGYFEPLPPPRRSAREVNIKAGLAALLFAALISTAFLMPVIMSSGIINRIPPLARFYCPDSGQLAPVHYSPSSSNSFVPYACLGLDGKRIEDPATHRLIRWSVDLASIAVLFPIAFLAARPIICGMRIRKR